jgi:hypothetical protein
MKEAKKWIHRIFQKVGVGLKISEAGIEQR